MLQVTCSTRARDISMLTQSRLVSSSSVEPRYKRFQRCRQHQLPFHFCDWFTQKRKAVDYKKFLRENYTERRFKIIIKPSETRWSFYKDVLESVPSQTDAVEKFLEQDKDFISTRQRLPFPGALVQQPRGFFSNKFILSHFSFALSILKTICGVNESLQEQYTILPVVWERIKHMRQSFYESLTQMRWKCQ